MTKHEEKRMRQLIEQHVQPSFHNNQYGKYVYLFAHVHAMEQCSIIHTVDVIGNFAAFCRLLAEMLQVDHFDSKKAYERYHYPSPHQLMLTEEIVKEYQQ